MSAGRRSGKTEIEGKRRLVVDALTETEVQGARFIAAAPTVAQAKEIFWNDLIALTPEWAPAFCALRSHPCLVSAYGRGAYSCCSRHIHQRCQSVNCCCHKPGVSH